MAVKPLFVVALVLAASFGSCDNRGPGTAYYLDTHLCVEVPQPVVMQLVSKECNALGVPSESHSELGGLDACAITLGVRAATKLEDRLWLVYGDVIGAPGSTSPDQGITGIYGFPLVGQPHHWLVEGALDGTGSSTRLDNGEFFDLLRERQTSERVSTARREISGPPPPTYCLRVVPQPTDG